MVKDFHVGDKSSASFFAGILISAFALSESLTGMYWGGLSDRIGRKPVLLIGCAGTMLSLLIVGFSTNFWVALLGRVVGGVLNGNIGVIQTMVGELVKRPEHEREDSTPLAILQPVLMSRQLAPTRSCHLCGQLARFWALRSEGHSRTQPELFLPPSPKMVSLACSHTCYRT